ncbi:MAG: hypothetical protein ACE5KM_20270 [Planctomycetaceae bacterium]
MRRRDAQRDDIRSNATQSRRAFLTPAVAVALVAVLLALALVLDAWWLENASVEMNGVAEASALAAGRALVTDDRLRDNVEETWAGNVERARRAALDMARRNQITGRRFPLHPYRDVRFGRLRWNGDGTASFYDTAHHPATVVVFVRRTRRNGNPIALFLRGLSGDPAAELTRAAEATVDDCVVGVRPPAGGAIPMWPLAIAEFRESRNDGSPADLHCWHDQIDQRRGTDDYTFDEATQAVLRRPDGIPELILRCNLHGERTAASNVCIVDLGSRLRVDRLLRQFRDGIVADDLKTTGGQLRLDAAPIAANSYGGITPAIRGRLTADVGKCRIVLLYRARDERDSNRPARVECSRLVAGRVMDVRTNGDGECEIIFQPGTLVTRAAVLAKKQIPEEQRSRYRNPCIYKLQLTN